MGSGLKAQNMTGISAQRKRLRAQKNGIRDHKAFEPKSGISFITRSKNLSSQYYSVLIRFVSVEFPGQGTLPVLASGWRQFLSHWYKVLVVWRKHDIIFLIDLIVEGTVIWISSHFSRFVTQLLNALSMPQGRERDFTYLYMYLFWREMRKRKKDKKKSCDRERYVSTSLTDLLLARVQA